ncbi:MAG: class I SAM-dependent methyltransferase [Desulfobacteraceae bacterium]|nr:class I SAM-dependent methyltransferase [Desulfobacteraceae bacterium]
MRRLLTFKDKLLENIKFKWFAKYEPTIAAVIERVHNDHLTYIDKIALVDLAKIVIENEEKSINGAIVETGCALGGSALLIAKAKKRNRPLAIYDVFGMIPPPSKKDGQDIHERYKKILVGKSQGIDGDIYYGYENDLLNKVKRSFHAYDLEPKRNSIIFIRGLYQDTVNIDHQISLAHIDCDWYESTMVCLERIAPHIVPGGTIVIDDYYHWSGCRTAVGEYFKGKKQYELRHRSRLHVIKKR